MMFEFQTSFHVNNAQIQPLPSHPASVAGAEKSSSSPVRLESDHPRVFILEDERLVAENIRMVLEDRGYEVIGIASSGEEALEAVRRITPDLLIMDIRVKGAMDGVETTILIHETLGKRIPTLFLTAHAREHFSHLAKLDPSSFIYLNKPYVDEELLRAVRKLLSGKE